MSLKRFIPSVVLLGAAIIWAAPAISSRGVAAEPVTLENVVPPTANTPDEPLADAYSLEKAVHFLDSAALDWTKSRQCFTCHTNYLYLMSRPAVGHDVSAHTSVRKALEELVTVRWPDKGPRWEAEVVQSAMVLAYNDSLTTGKLHPTTKIALDRMWTLQRPDGGFNWLKCDWPPMESDDDYGAAVALLAVGAAPEGYRDTPEAKAGVAKILEFLKKNPPPTVHHRAMLLWASTLLPGVLSDEQKKATVDELLGLQRADGGWNLGALGTWKREDGSEQTTDKGDGYGTGLAVFVLRRAGVPASDPKIAKGVQWLKSNQRASGRWFTRSVHKDSRHFITHAGTAMAVMAITACEPEKAAAAGE